MKDFKVLYQKAVSATSTQKLPESINDLLIRDFNEEELSLDESKALQNYLQFRNDLLGSAIDDTDFSDKIKKLRIIANFTPWREFLNDYK
ncbi:MAG: hypothetical protein N2203_05355 [Bacteroidia bacterium]|nr:hypothetical protein [Bacteroidia bacterium]